MFSGHPNFHENLEFGVHFPDLCVVFTDHFCCVQHQFGAFGATMGACGAQMGAFGAHMLVPGRLRRLAAAPAAPPQKDLFFRG